MPTPSEYYGVDIVLIIVGRAPPTYASTMAEFAPHHECRR